jgi:hypothetical protein
LTLDEWTPIWPAAPTARGCPDANIRKHAEAQTLRSETIVVAPLWWIMWAI